MIPGSSKIMNKKHDSEQNASCIVPCCILQHDTQKP